MKSIKIIVFSFLLLIPHNQRAAIQEATEIILGMTGIVCIAGVFLSPFIYGVYVGKKVIERAAENNEKFRQDLLNHKAEKSKLLKEQNELLKKISEKK